MLWPILLAVLIIILIWKFNEKNHLDELPGPKKHPIIGCALTFMRLTQFTMFQEVRKFAKMYGDRYLVKIFNRRILHINNPNDVEIVLAHSKNISKNKIYKYMKPWLGDGLILSTGYKWHVRRKILTPTFHFNILKNFAPIIEDTTRDFVNKLKLKPETELNLYPAVSDFTLCTICETAMGTQLGQDKTAATVEYKSSIIEMGGLIMKRLTRVWLQSDFIYKRVAAGRYFYKVLGKVHSFADRVILERKNSDRDVSDETDGEVLGKKKRLAMLDLLLKAESEGHIDLEGIREEVNTFMFAGHDTTAAALQYALMLLADHDDVQERVHEECVRIFGDTDRVASMSDLAEMKYLEAVIKETLRLYPSVPFIARTITEDFMMGDLLVKRGTEIGIHIYDLHRRPDLYPDPETFNPDRFLGGAVRHTYGFVPFSAGPRNCIGQRFAMQEMKCFLSEICRSFRLEPRIRGWRPAMLADSVLRSAEPIYVKFIRR